MTLETFGVQYGGNERFLQSLDALKDDKFDAIGRRVSSQSSLEALKSLLQLKKDVYAALATEWNAVNNESDAVESLHVQNTLKGGLANFAGALAATKELRQSSHCAPSSSFPLLKGDSLEFKRVQELWKNGLKNAITTIQHQTPVSDKVTLDDLDEIQNDISKLQSLYFKCVADRDASSKLWLRLKMYTQNRRAMLKPHVAEFEHCSSSAPPQYSKLQKSSLESSTVSKEALGASYRQSSTASSNYSSISRSSSNAARARVHGAPSLHKTVSTTSLGCPKSFGLKRSASTVVADDANVTRLFLQATSVPDFKDAASLIYAKYAGEGMTVRVFYNIVDFLARSLCLPTLDRAPIRRLLTIYNIGPETVISEFTFLLLYWEVLHLVKASIEILNTVELTYNVENIPLDTNELSDDASDVGYTDFSSLFEFRRKLASGTSCNKYVARELGTDELVVVEILCKGPETPTFSEIQQEVMYLKQFEHQHLVAYIDVYHDHNCIYIVSEFAHGGSLLQYLHAMSRGGGSMHYSLSFVHLIFTQVLEGLLYIHCNNGVHGSLSIEKVMIDNDGASALDDGSFSTDYIQVKLRDSGTFRFLNRDLCETALTRLHFAPETSDVGVGPKTDIWACGVLLFFLVTGRMPYENLESRDFVQHLRLALSKSSLLQVDEILQDLICKMLSPQPEHRPTAFEVVSHPWYLSREVNKAKVSAHLLSNPTQHIIACKNLQRQLIKAFENQDAFYVIQLPKLADGIELVKRRDATIAADILSRILQSCNLPFEVVKQVIDGTSLENSNLCNLDGKCYLPHTQLSELYAACKRWKMGQVIGLWSRVLDCSRGTKGVYVDAVEFKRLLVASQTALVPRAHVPRLCQLVAKDGLVKWQHFLRFVDAGGC